MKTYLSGIQPSGKPHLGNYLGAMKQQLETQEDNKLILFIADLHALTTVKDAKKMKEQTLDIAASYIALGLDPEKTIFFKQSAVSEHSELCWIFDCLVKIPFLERAHAWKDAKEKGKKEVTVGLFNYPILQAADILLYKPDIIPVGQDQKQHIEMARDIALKFNETFGETFPLPEELIKEEVAIVPGTDGQKMSKSYGNTIDIFTDEKTLKKQIMSIVTDSKPLEEPKDPDTCHVYKLFKLLSSKEESSDLASKYRAGNFGYGHAKTALLEKTLATFASARKRYDELIKNTAELQDILEKGSEKAKAIASTNLKEVKTKIGFL